MPRTDTCEQELRDPTLAALLKDAFAEDPALEEAPGRTERIMRRVLTTGVRPAPAPWLAWGWATGLAAAAAAVVLLLLGPLNGPKTDVVHTDPSAPAPQEQAAPQQAPLLVEKITGPRATVTAPVEQPRRAWHQPEAPTAPPAAGTPDPASAAPDASPTVVAAALYTAGSAAQTVGDYETAYEAYSASYEALPNPETLLAASDALLLMARDTAGSGG
ncbi:MAG TPA: hypothetical protein PLZ36_05830 [Armatimonadota bacterium]|nr:hypothetical protein [Armatimonadota bacterium]